MTAAGIDSWYHEKESAAVHRALRSAPRMVLIGGGADAMSFLVGRLLGVAIG